MIKFGKALRGFGRLVWDPFDFAGAMVLFDAFEAFGPVRDAYARMVSELEAGGGRVACSARQLYHDREEITVWLRRA